WVVKIANAAEDQAALDFQAALLRHAATIDPDLPLPLLQPTLAGEMLGTCTGPEGARHYVRMVTWLPGKPLALAPKSPELLAHFGGLLGCLTRALQGFAHVGAIRPFDWDLTQAGTSRARLGHINDPEQRALLEYF